MFDAKEYMEAVEPPVFRAPNGRVYTGRVLSHQEWLPLQRHLNSLQNTHQLTREKLYEAARKLTRAMFPKPWWKVWERSATYHVLRLPPVGLLKALWSFMDAQAPALGIELEAPAGALEDSGDSQPDS